MDNRDIFILCKCYDCGKKFLVSGSVPTKDINCTYCNSKNFDHVEMPQATVEPSSFLKRIKIFITNFFKKTI